MTTNDLPTPERSIDSLIWWLHQFGTNCPEATDIIAHLLKLRQIQNTPSPSTPPESPESQP